MLDQMSKEELEALKYKAYKEMRKLTLSIANKKKELREHLGKVQLLEEEIAFINTSLQDTKSLVAKNSDKEEKDPSLKLSKAWNDAIAGAINFLYAFQKQYEKAQEQYKTFLGEGNIRANEWRQVQSKYNQKYALYIKLSIQLAQRAVESDDFVSNENTEEDPQTSYSRMRFS